MWQPTVGRRYLGGGEGGVSRAFCVLGPAESAPPGIKGVQIKLRRAIRIVDEQCTPALPCGAAAYLCRMEPDRQGHSNNNMSQQGKDNPLGMEELDRIGYTTFPCSQKCTWNLNRDHKAKTQIQQEWFV